MNPRTGISRPAKAEHVNSATRHSTRAELPMAVPSARDGASADGDAGFVGESYLAYIVPQATDGHLEEALATCASEGRSPQALIESIEDRDSLFFDETVGIYLILRTPYQSETRMRSYLDRIALSLEAHIVNGQVSGRESVQPVVESIFNGAVENVPTPLAIVHDPDTSTSKSATNGQGTADDDSSEDDSDSDSDGTETVKKQDEGDTQPARQTFFVWKLPVFLARPRARLHSPSVVFAAAASLKPVVALPPTANAADGSLPVARPLAGDEGLNGRMAAGYLRSREPSGLNLLESFGGDPALAGVWPRLSAQRVSRVAPATTSAFPRFQPRPLRGLKSIDFRIFPAVHTRVRFARPNAVPTNPAVVAMLEVDFTPFFECEAVMSGIEVSLPSGTVTDLNTAEGLALPLYCVARDHFTFLYRLTPLEYDVSRPLHHQNHPGKMLAGGGGAATRDLDITIKIKVLVKPGVCTPVLKMSWATSLDFTLPVNPGFGTALMPQSSLQRSHRPSQLSIDGMSSFTAPSVSRPDALPSLEAAAARSKETTIPDFGITMTLTAPPHKVYAGEEFTWTVFVVNRASQAGGGPGAPSMLMLPGGPGAGPQHHAARKLALIAIPKRRRNDVRVIRPPSTAGGQRHSHHLKTAAQAGGHGGNDVTEPVADAVLDENVVHAMQRSSLVDSTDVVCLSSADTRVGPLAPNACHVVELRFVALRAGVVGVEAIRVIDLGSQEHVDVHELPAMIIAEGQRGDGEEKA
ncbi:hypothetical protein F503_02320 [Ophiostoma piceae UAMH 11346]|uniref:Trafficking protein particle complex II-specific subunit 65 IgD3 domain-containing protein n=1 Tax=Ophiostoma piceae (strain UAMH 11346) TaxID=1262450 RepID=S3C1I4_OPHP1|nr:hypothetical protein F503_02320 [Ophiostoma piceae UAMH 11346]